MERNKASNFFEVHLCQKRGKEVKPEQNVEAAVSID